VAADGAKGIEHLSREVEPRHAPALEGRRVHLTERHAAARHLRLLEALVAAPGERVAGEPLHQRPALLAPELRQLAPLLHPHLLEELLREPGREVIPEDAEDARRAPCLKPLVPGLGVQGAPLHKERLSRPARLAGTHGEVGDVEHRGAAVPAMGEEKSAC
jgi:hypothetical protein